MKRTIRKVAAVVLGLMLGVSAWAGLETVTHISDLNSSWPLGSDLASTSDDHIRNIKVALKTDFPNINGVVNSTVAQLNQLSTSTFTSAQSIAAASASLTINSTTATNAALTFYNLNSTNKIRFGTEGTAGATITGSAQGDGVLFTSGGSLLVSTSAGNLNFKVDGAGAATLQGASGSLTLNSTTSTNASLELFSLGGSNKARFGVEGTSGSTITGSTANDLLAFTTGGNFIVSTNSGGAVGFKIAGSNGAVSSVGPTAAALVDMTPDTGTFTATYVGFSSATTCTASWYRIGKTVTLMFCAATNTSNATTFTMTGLPAAIQPTTTQTQPIGQGAVRDNGSVPTTFPISAQVGASGTVTFLMEGSVSLWTASGSKGFVTAASISYGLF